MPSSTAIEKGAFGSLSTKVANFTYLPFSQNSAAKTVQRKLMEQFQDMKSIVIIDDLVIYGMNQEHDRQLHELLQKCQKIGVKLNPDKLQIGLDAIIFM